MLSCLCVTTTICVYTNLSVKSSVSHYTLSVITQDGDSALMKAAKEGRTEVVPLLLDAEANTDLQNKVHVGVHVQVVWEEI